MKILHVNKSDTIGGASVAALRLVQAQRSAGMDSYMLVQEKTTQLDYVFSTTQTELKKKLNFYRLALEKLMFLPYEINPEFRFAFSTSNTGENIVKNKHFKQADIIHLHWFNQGFLSIGSLRKILRSGKKVVWTMHDMWAFTGGCHYANECNAFMSECGHCPFIKGEKENDKSTTIFRRKERLYAKAGWTFVSPSNWLKQIAHESVLLRNFDIDHIENPIDLNLFKPGDKLALREKYHLPPEKKLILFGAMNISDKRKGLDYFLRALHLLKNRQISDDIALVIFGKSTTEFRSAMPFATYDLSVIKDVNQMVDIYQMADIFVIPSLEDNLPNTVVESHACGLPVVAFDNAGLTEMIHHEEDGYLASFKSVDDLAMGIYWTLFEASAKQLSHNARINAEINYNASEIALRYNEIYKHLIHGNKAY